MKKIKINKEKIRNAEKKVKNKMVDIKDSVKNSKIRNTSKTCLIFLGIIALFLLLLSWIMFGKYIAILFTFGYIVISIFTLILDNNTEQSTKRKIVKTVLKIILGCCIIGVICFILFFIYIAIASPKFDVDKLKRGETTLIYDKDDKLIATLGSERREKVTYNELPEVLVDAIVATEDSRFFQHNGFDAPRFAKATLGQLLGSSSAGGGSTLTMQVAKNNFTSLEAIGIKGIIRKFTDIYLSVFKIEKKYTKQEIIEFYVNTPFLGSNSYGVEQASQTYFGKHATELNLAEASLIAGLFQAPGYYDPYVNPDIASERREVVLSLMVKHGYITKEEADIANAVPVKSLLVSETYVTSNQYQGYLDEVINEVTENTGLDPYVTPMLIYTNMDTKKQEAMDKVFLGETFTWANDTIQGGAVAIESNTGKIVAIGAGRNRSGERVFSYATDIERQVGSTAKPLFDYGPGIEYNNWSTGKIFNDVPWSYSGSSSKIVNYDGRYLGKITMRYALSDSRNVPAVQAFQQVDNKKIKQFVTTLGIKPEIDSNGYLHEAHAVGAFNGASPLEMAGAYAAFSNGGNYYKPYSVRKLVLRDTNEEKEFKSEKVKAMSDSTAYMITDILKGVASQIGASSLTTDQVASKTGTTNYDQATRNAYGYPSAAAPDGWIVGYTPNMVVSIWTGYVENIKGFYLTQNQMVNQRNGLFKACAKASFNSTGATFTKPSSVVSVQLEKGTELLASANTPENMKVTELFKKGTEPTEQSSAYKLLDNPTGLTATYSDQTVKLTWNSVNKPTDIKTDGYGNFGYRVYLDGVELGFTTNNYYNYSTSNPYGTYTVKTAFSGVNSNMSSGVTYKMESNIKFEFNGMTSQTISIGASYNELSTPITVKEDGVDVTSFASTTIKIVDDSTGSEVNNVDTSSSKTYTITYKAIYKGESESFTKSLTVR